MGIGMGKGASISGSHAGGCAVVRSVGPPPSSTPSKTQSGALSGRAGSRNAPSIPDVCRCTHTHSPTHSHCTARQRERPRTGAVAAYTCVCLCARVCTLEPAHVCVCPQMYVCAVCLTWAGCPRAQNPVQQVRAVNLAKNFPIEITCATMWGMSLFCPCAGAARRRRRVGVSARAAPCYRTEGSCGHWWVGGGGGN
jgi:hypothetical protein